MAVWIRGFGVLIELAPTAEMAHVANAPPALIGAFTDGGTLRNCIVRVPDAVPPGRAVLLPDRHGSVVGFTAREAPALIDEREWSLTTTAYRCGWPPDLLLLAGGPDSRWPFELEHQNGVGFIVLRGPLRGAEVPAPDALVAPGQRVAAHDFRADQLFVDLEYEHDGEALRQRHRYAVVAPETVVIVTAQAPVEHADTLFEMADTIARSVTLLG